MKTVTDQLRKFNTKLLRVTLQLQKLVQKKEDCVNAQNALENDFFTTDLVTCRKYQKLIELDFDLAQKIFDTKKEFSRIKAQIKREANKALLCN